MKIKIEGFGFSGKENKKFFWFGDDIKSNFWSAIFY